MAMEKKKKTVEEIMFAKRWAKKNEINAKYSFIKINSW